MRDDDNLICTHRNIHYQFSRGATIDTVLEEFQLNKNGLAGGTGGSMNLTNPEGSIIYTSSILGNNLCASIGVALSMKIRQANGVVIVVSGDGAMEEGAFYESIENARKFDLKLIVVVENNNWSLASKVDERRKPIDLSQLASSLGAGYTFMSGNSPDVYYNNLAAVREKVCLKCVPEIVEVGLTTLGGWMIHDDGQTYARYVNYHAGLSPKLNIQNGLLLSNDDSDPVFLIKKQIGDKSFNALSESILNSMAHYLI
jgi:pyruvate dehydrogenase E1 component alpha subunit